jgi:S-adenosylmethionine hydrolase
MVITLTTDFGTKEPYAGIMKGVILGLNPKAAVIDLTHEIEPQNINEAAFVLRNACKYFPAETVHIVVVDPGVGSPRRAIALKRGKYFFVGPDNGVFTEFFPRAEKIVQIKNKKYLLPLRGATFHGRDVFAPAAAWLSRGLPLEELGPEIKDPVKIKPPKARKIKDSIKGEIVHIDRFGNCISNIEGELIAELKKEKKKILVKVKGTELPLVPFYSYKGVVKAGAVINSDGLLEIFVYEGNAAREMGIKTGDAINVLGRGARRVAREIIAPIALFLFHSFIFILKSG